MMTDKLICIEQVTLSFGGLHALKEVSFHLKKNTITGLIGPNGAGKTTLFNCLTGFYAPDRGQIYFQTPSHSIELLRLTKKPHRISRLGIVRTFQHPRVFKEMTVLENLLIAKQSRTHPSFLSGLLSLPAYRKWEKEIVQSSFDWLKKFDLEKEANQLAGELSYGKQKLLEIARAMCTDPLLLCLDEPAAGLNAHETKMLAELLINLKKEYNLTILLIEHDMSFVMRLCHQIVVLNYGEVISQGSPEYICQDKKVIDAYLGKNEN